jgi:hypothetical protein
MAKKKLPVRTGHATIDPFEPVIYDYQRATEGLPPWRSVNTAPLAYHDSEVKDGCATIEPFERVTYDRKRAAKNLPPWIGKRGPMFYLDSEVQES